MKDTLSLNAVSFSYQDKSIINDISFAVQQGEVACLLGPSGCGKSTLLRLIAGFETPERGAIKINDHAVADASNFIQPQQRAVGMLFQDLALFPHLTVSKNIAFGLNGADSERVDELLELCRIAPFRDRFPHQLSGGQKQRVALARAMAPKPRIMLLDEPFSSVDQGLQIDLVHEVKDMLMSDESTVLWVTHNLSEACAVADHVGLMVAGELVQWSSPHELYHQPQNPVVIDFLNQGSLISGRVTDSGRLETPLGLLEIQNQQQFSPAQSIKACVLSDQLVINEQGLSNAHVMACVYQGSHYQLTIKLQDGQELRLKSNRQHAVDEAISISVNDTALIGFGA